MKIIPISEMELGWFVGNFEPTAFKTKDVEVAYKIYSKNENHTAHYHRIATEINYLVKGVLEVKNGSQWVLIKPGEIFIFDPYDVAECKFITACEIVVVKVPSVKGDKYVTGEDFLMNT